MTPHRPFHLIWLSFLLSACATPPQPFEILNSGPQTSLRANSSQVAVITDEAEFAELFDRISANKLPPPDAPKVDFTQNIVIYVSRDPKPSAGYGLKVRSVVCSGGVMSVALKEVDPQGIAGQAQVITQPYVVLTTARCPKLTQVEISGADLAALRPIPVAPK